MKASLIRSFDIVAYPPAQRRHIDLGHAAAAGKIEGMGRGRAHSETWTHDLNARNRGAIAIDAAAYGH
jgi:hypothetical protein